MVRALDCIRKLSERAAQVAPRGRGVDVPLPSLTALTSTYQTRSATVTVASPTASLNPLATVKSKLSWPVKPAGGS